MGINVSLCPEPIRLPVGQAVTTVDQINLDKIFLGCGVPRPFRRDQKGDYANECSEPLVLAAVGQVVATQAQTGRNHGELPWRPEFGSRVHILRHAPNNAELDPIAETYVAMAIERWEPRAQVQTVRVSRNSTNQGGDNVLEIEVGYAIAGRTPGVASPTQTATVVVPF